MIHPRKILAKLPQYNNDNEELVHKQNVADIINGVDLVHQKFANDYDLICEEFIGTTPLQTCKNLFNFLRYSTVYKIEDEDFQSLRSPASILATGTKLGIDCKNLALWIGGCLDAINRSGYQYIPFVYRFASDKEFDKTPNHVFIVAFPDTNNEIWIDPIPQVTYFNEKLRYNYFQDKNIHKMSLNILSGRMGFTIPGIGVDTDDVADVANILSDIFSNRPNPNDWKGWETQEQSQGMPLGTSANFFTKYDGDSIQNEAINIINWIKQYGINTVVGYNSWNKWTVTLEDIAAKIKRGGMEKEASDFIKASKSSSKNNQTNKYTDQTGVNTQDSTQAGMNIYVTLGLVGVGIYLISRMKK